MATEPPCWVQGGGLEMCGMLNTPMLCTICGVPQCGVSLTQTSSPPLLSSQNHGILWVGGGFKGYFVQIRMLNVVLSTIQAFNYIMCGLEVEGHD